MALGGIFLFSSPGSAPTTTEEGQDQGVEEMLEAEEGAGEVAGQPEPLPGEEGEESEEGEQAETVIISYTDNGFTPSTVTVSSGTTVVFENNSSQSMRVASDPHPVHTALPEFDARQGVAFDQSYDFTFTQEGSWGFHNHLAPQHGGTVIVE